MKKIIAATLLGLAICSSLHAKSATFTNANYFAINTGVSHLSTSDVFIDSTYSPTFGLAYGKRFNEFGFELSYNILGFNKTLISNPNLYNLNVEAADLIISNFNADFNYYYNMQNNISIKGIIGVAYVVPTAISSGTTYSLRDQDSLAGKIGIGGHFAMTENMDFVTSLNFLKTFKKDVLVDNMLYLSAGIAF
jgi:hypothetical protein